MIILKMVLQESECMGIDWIRLDEVPNMVMWWPTCNYNTCSRGRRASFLILLMMGAWRLKHVEWLCRNKTCTVLHQVGCFIWRLVGFLSTLNYDARSTTHQIYNEQCLVSVAVSIPSHVFRSPVFPAQCSTASLCGRLEKMSTAGCLGLDHDCSKCNEINGSLVFTNKNVRKNFQRPLNGVNIYIYIYIYTHTHTRAYTEDIRRAVTFLSFYATHEFTPYSFVRRGESFFKLYEELPALSGFWKLCDCY